MTFNPKDRHLLNIIIEASNLIAEEKRLLNPSLALVLVHDIVLNRGGIQAPTGPVKQAVLRHKTRLKAEWIKTNLRTKVNAGGNAAVNKYRFVRVNTNLWTLNHALDHYQSRGFSLLQSTGEARPEKLSVLHASILAYNLVAFRWFSRDDHVDNLLCFPSGTSFEEDSAYISGKAIIQDKAS